jgi:MSHA pilin protein MshD
MNRDATSSRRSALTLIEAMLSIVIVATVIVMAMNTFGSLANSRQISANRFIANGLARQLMGEILQCYYADPNGGTTLGPDSGETTRSLYDDVDDYNGWSESPPQSHDGNVLPGFTGWKRQVAVAYIDPSTMATTAQDLGVKRVTVTVTDPLGAVTTVVGIRSSNGVYDQKPASATTAYRWVGVLIQSGSNSKSQVTSGVDISNIVPGGS